MRDVGVRELKARASEIIRNVREQRARYVITHWGTAGGPVDSAGQGKARCRVLGRRNRVGCLGRLTPLGTKIGREWKSPQTSVELLSDMRR